jgi:glycosyltransferase involved in cell wall biosynthesis
MPKGNYKYRISIILTTYQSHASLSHSINNILLQNFNPKYYEIICISHGVPDALSGHIFNLVSNCKRIFVEKTEKSYEPCRVRNQGIAQAEGKLVLFMHDNVDLIGADWLKRLWQYSINGSRAVMTRKLAIRYNSDGSVGRIDDVAGFYAHQDAIPLEYLREVGGFDEEYDGDAGMDDVDLMKRCQLQGCSFHMSDLTSIKHNLRDLYPKQVTAGNWDGNRNRGIFYGKKGFTFP